MISYFRDNMRYRKLKAHLIFTGTEWLDENKVLITDESGAVQDIVEEQEAGEEIEVLEGILAPGFINCHCHLELSHLKGVIPPHTGLINFLLKVVTNRAAEEELILQEIIAAEGELFDNGIAGVADISNTTHTIQAKQKSRVRWHNLVEVINLYDQNLEKQWAHYSNIRDAYESLPGKVVLTPHAPYTVSAATFKKLNTATANQIISIHNQETRSENELFETGSGDFLKLYAHFGSSQSPFAVSKQSSLQTWLPYFTEGQTILLVHNTFISEEDIVFAQQHARQYGLKLIYCLCPNANLYIENALPPIDLLLKHDCQIVLGTDSYSSNWQLSIVSEIKTLLQHFPDLDKRMVLQWATSNGADALGWNDLGRLNRGTKPGVVLIDGRDFSVKRIV